MSASLFLFLPSHLSLGTLPADHPQLIAATLWRGCFLSSCSGFYIWAPGPASQEELMGNQSSGVVAALLEIVRTVSRRSPGLSDSLSVFLSRPSRPPTACVFISARDARRHHRYSEYYPSSRSPQETPSTCWCVSPLLAPSGHIVWGIWIVVTDLQEGGKTKAMKTASVGRVSASQTLSCLNLTMYI